MYYIVSEVCIGGYFFGECFSCFSQQIKYAVANESQIAYNLVKRAPIFFLGRELLLIDLKLGTHTSKVKKFKEAIKNF